MLASVVVSNAMARLALGTSGTSAPPRLAGKPLALGVTAFLSDFEIIDGPAGERGSSFHPLIADSDGQRTFQQALENSCLVRLPFLVPHSSPWETVLNRLEFAGVVFVSIVLEIEHSCFTRRFAGSWRSDVSPKAEVQVFIEKRWVDVLAPDTIEGRRLALFVASTDGNAEDPVGVAGAVVGAWIFGATVGRAVALLGRADLP